MVNVIKNGKDEIYEIECIHCGSTLSYTRADLIEKKEATEFFDRFVDCKIRTVSQFETAYTGIVCPVCGEFRTVECLYFNKKIGSRLATKNEKRLGIIHGGVEA